MIVIASCGHVAYARRVPDTTNPCGGSPWLGRVLVAAGAYNLLWGATVVVAPDFPFRLAEMEPLAGTGRAIWQCLGMVIGVYGIGYLAASTAPARHWPIVLVGLLGKVFGPIGFIWTATRGDIPWAFGWTILTNDLIWWVPFAMILRRAWCVSRAEVASIGVSERRSG